MDYYRDMQKYLAERLNAVAHLMNSLAYVDYSEPGLDSIDEMDKILGVGPNLPDPLLSAHRAIRGYLLGAGAAFYSGSQLLQFQGGSEPLGVSSCLRTGLEYSSRAMFLADTRIGHVERIIRFIAVHNDSVKKAKTSKNDRIDELLEVSAQLYREHPEVFTKTLKSKNKLPDNTRLIEAIDESLGDFYRQLSQRVHGNLNWIWGTMISAQKRANLNDIDVILSSFLAVRVGLESCENVMKLWSATPKDVSRVFRRHQHIPESTTDSELENVFNIERLRRSIDIIEGRLDILQRKRELDTSEDPQPKR